MCRNFVGNSSDCVLERRIQHTQLFSRTIQLTELFAPFCCVWKTLHFAYVLAWFTRQEFVGNLLEFRRIACSTAARRQRRKRRHTKTYFFFSFRCLKKTAFCLCFEDFQIVKFVILNKKTLIFLHFKNWLTWHAFEFFSRLLRAKMLAFSLCFQPMENLNNAKFQKNTKKLKTHPKKVRQSSVHFFLEQSSLLNFFLVFAACEKHCVLLMFWLDSLVGNLSEFRRIACWSKESSLLNFFLEQSSLLNFFVVFAACEKHCILLMFWLDWLVGNLSKFRQIECSRAAAAEKSKKKNWTELRSARRHKTSHFGRGGAIYIYMYIESCAFLSQQWCSYLFFSVNSGVLTS